MPEAPTRHGSVPLNVERVEHLLGAKRFVDACRVRDILAKALHMKGLAAEEVADLFDVSDPELLAELFDAAQRIKQAIYGSRLVLFAPLYISNLCRNECAYCAFRARNAAVNRRALTMSEVAEDTRVLVGTGHKRVLLVAGESYPSEGLDYVLNAIETVYATRITNGEIRRVNVNIAPLTVDEFKHLRDAQIGTYQLFQETYHRPTYARVHVAGQKRDYDWRVTAMDRAMAAGIDDVGIGVLFGLFDWRFEILALLEHIKHLEDRFGVGPHTISVPRLEPASGSDLAGRPPFPVSDADFRKIVAILRLAVPYTGIIMSTRETPSIRREAFALGVSQISAGSRTNPGGYCRDNDDDEGSQFSLGDHRSLDEVIRDIAELGYVPSFCTACYRLGRTGADFMDLAKPGEVRSHCEPNAVSTFAEYLEDYASRSTREAGWRLIDKTLREAPEAEGRMMTRLVAAVLAGRRDVFV